MSAWGDVSRPVPPSGTTVRMRLSGTRRGCAEAAARLHRLFHVTSVSQPYPEPGSSRLVQVYVRVRLDLHPEPPPAAAVNRPCSDDGSEKEGPARG